MPPTKRRKLSTPSFRGVSISATAKISQHIQQNPEDLNSSQSASAHLRQESTQHHNLWGEWKVRMVPLKRRDGGTVDWALPNVSALLMWHYEHNPLFRKAMERAVKANPNMPLSLTTTCDEFTPGNVLHPEQRNKNACGFCLRRSFRGNCLASACGYQ